MFLQQKDMRINSFPELAKKVKVCFKKWSYFYCRWATAYSRKMRKISNLLSLYLYEFSSCMNKTAQNCRGQLLNGGVWWDLNLSQLVVSDIFCFSTSISIWRVFSSSSIQYSMLDGTSFGTFLLPGLLVCLFGRRSNIEIGDQLPFPTKYSMIWSFQK